MISSRVSDIDLIAVVRDAPDEALVRRLASMHEDLVRAEPDWNDRIEVVHVSARGLAQCRTHTTTIARISPGEPLHAIEAGRDFLLDWYPARQDGIALLGPPIDALIPEIPEAEYLDEVRRYVAGFRGRFERGPVARFAGVCDPHDVSSLVRAEIRHAAVETGSRDPSPAGVSGVGPADRPRDRLARPAVGR